MNRLVVRQHRPGAARLLLLLAGVAVALAAWGLYEYGRIRVGHDIATVEAERAALARELAEVRERLERSREQRAIAERSGQVEGKAYEMLKEDLAGLQEEIAELKEELAFYRGIVSPRDSARGLRLERFNIRPIGTAGTYRYELVLTQVLKNDTVTRGRVELEIEGTRDGERTRLPLAAVTPDAVEALNFRFKYFQDFAGDIVLPAGFRALRVLIKVNPSGGEHAVVEKEYEWPEGG